MYNIIMFTPFGDTFKTDLLGQSTTTLSQLLPVVALVVGILLAFLVIRSIVNMIMLRKNYPDDDNTDDVDDDDFDDGF